MTNWTKPTIPSTSWSGVAKNPTSYTNPVKTQTTWTLGSANATQFSGRDITNLGAIMDDSVYKMDSSLINMDDAILNPVNAPSTSWT